MPKQTNYNLLAVPDWLHLADDPAIRKRMATDPYSMAYRALRSHFSGVRRMTWYAAVLGLHIVYGWMPTMPKLGSIMRWDKVRRDQLTNALTKATLGHVLTDGDLRTLRAFCNNSMTGASKLLHFLSPSKFPIWDSRVARVFLNHPRAGAQQANAIEVWKCYQATLAKWSANPQVKKKCEELRSVAWFLAGVSDLRLVELVLFHKTTRTRRKQASAWAGAPRRKPEFPTS
jgi:hypothetical protein